MVYEYHCPQCKTNEDIIKAAADYDRDEYCAKCGGQMDRQFNPKIHLYGTAVEDRYYCPSLGQVVRSKAHAEQLGKDRGWEMIGNEKPEKHIKPVRQEYDF